ncbi:helix-turn-helix domain-containing protein [Mucilaginibacter sp. BT774]|uniref:helix-turn-helix domain-containing protein n=1 Tax=Mucilaginibacter sp. BT774 TaxID=3062276 RepID=UPI002674D765|nr:helix-turn-helix domain-containing protein [Mucilaginibacter sp. BT774]MDO3626605.1 helix-turn-helix domain-containing protein [Mucilaginibacter sp. BT774]
MAHNDLQIEHYSASEQLKPYVKTFLFINSIDGADNRLLPDTSIVLAFRIKGNIIDQSQDEARNLPQSVITGLRKSPRFLSYAVSTACLLVIFKEGGAAAIFKEPLHELFSRSMSLNEIIPVSQLELVEEQLIEAEDNKQRVGIVERFLLLRLDERRADQMVVRAIQKIKQTSGTIKVSALASDMAISLDPFEKRFRKVTGISPKQFAVTVRFRNLINQFSATESLTELALTAGYFDQAHFIKDFRTFTGMSPREFFKTEAWW